MNIAVLRPDPAALPILPSEETDKGGRILIVDDVRANRDILMRRLGRRGYDVIEAANGLECLEVVDREKLDLILLDIMMPDLDGTVIVREIRKSRSASELPIIMVSAKSRSEDVAESLDLGANDYVTKPVDFTIALARIRTQIHRKRMADEAERVALAERESLRHASDLLQAEAEEHLKSREMVGYLACHDDLTGLLNRSAFRAAVAVALSGSHSVYRGLALICIDLDQFKAINTIHGSEVGDAVLRQASERLKTAVPDAIAYGRLGGDEFGVLVAENGHSERADLLGDTISTALARPFLHRDARFEVQASLGIATADRCDGEVETLILAAELATACAKSKEQTRAVLFEPQLLRDRRELARLGVDLRHAIERDDLDVFYQPLLDAQTREVRCLEALARWRHPEQGMISPAIFIPLAEEIGLINAIGGRVLRKACQEAASWPRSVRVAVNLSPEQFGSSHLIREIVAAVGAAGLEPGRLELEITESCLLSAGDETTQMLKAIRELGFRIALDDFGTGYSSLGYLQSFEFDKLKIDRRFVRDMETNPKTSAIVNAIVDLSGTLGISTAAEGIETPTQLEAVVSRGCSEVQGFLFSPAMPARDAGAYIRNAAQSRS